MSGGAACTRGGRGAGCSRGDYGRGDCAGATEPHRVRDDLSEEAQPAAAG